MMLSMNSVEGCGQPSSEASPDSADSSSQPQLTYTRTSCDLCKRMKIKCERQGENCVHCIGRGLKCEMTLVKRKKQVKRGTPLQDVESRIQRIESVLKASGLDGQLADVTPNVDTAEPPANLTDKLSTLLISEEGNSRFLGASSGFSLFSPQGLQWISERTGSNELSESISRIASNKSPWPVGQTEIWHPLPPLDREPLPPKHLADLYVARYFDTFNSIFPLYNEASFYEYYELQYLGRPTGGIAWYASLNVILCFGSLILHDERRQRELPLAETTGFREQQGWKYFRNATGCFVDLMFGFYGNLMAVQAICGLVFIQQITLDPQPFYILLAAAGRLALGMGLHRKLDGFGLSQSEINQRRNVFWILYFLDKSMSIRIGQPSVMFDDDVGIDLPQETEISHVLPDGSMNYSIFRCHAQLALLESRIYTELYSIKASNSAELQRLKSVSQLDKDLLEWREALPIEIRPEETIQCSREQFIPVVMMHFTYLNCLTTVHRASMNHGSWINLRSKQAGTVLHDQHLNPRVYASHSICLAAARSTIELLQRVSNFSPRNSLVWMVLYFPLSSFLLLFANLLQNPQDSHIESDLKLMELVISFLTQSTATLSPYSTPASIQMFHQLYRIAVKFVEKSNAQDKKKVKRVHDDIDGEEGSQFHPTEKFTTSHITILPTKASYHRKEPNNGLSNPAVYDTQAQPYRPQDFMQFPMGLPDSIPDGTSLSTGDILYPNMAGVPLFSDSVQWEWDLQNLWNGYFMPESRDPV